MCLQTKTSLFVWTVIKKFHLIGSMMISVIVQMGQMNLPLELVRKIPSTVLLKGKRKSNDTVFKNVSKSFFSVKVLLRGYLVVASTMVFATAVMAVMNGPATNLYLKPSTKGNKKSYINSKHHAMIDVILENKMF